MDADMKLKNYIALMRAYKYRDLDQLKVYCSEVYDLEDVRNPAYQKAMADYYMAYYHQHKGNLVQAHELIDNVIDFGISSNDFSFESSAKNEKAILFGIQGQFDEAIELYEGLIANHLERGEEDKTIAELNNIGILFERIKDKKKALDYYKKSYAIANKFSNTYDINLAAGNIANIYISLNKLDSAKHYSQICMKYAVQGNYLTSIGFANSLLGRIYMKETDYPKAERHIQKAVDGFDTLGQDFLFITAASNLAELQNAKEKHHEALKTGKTLLEKSKRTNHLNGQKAALQSIMIAHEKLGKPDQAYTASVEYRVVMDSLYNQEKASSLYDIQQKYESAKKDAEIKTQELRIEKQLATRNYLLGGLIGLVLLILYIFSRYRLRQRIARNELKLKQEKIDNLEQKQKLVAMDHVLQGQESERKRIAKDLHDGLGGLLATALLQLQQFRRQKQTADDRSPMIEAEHSIDTAYAEVRRIAHDMMPSALANLGLQSAVQDLADKINNTEKLRVITHFSLNETMLSDQQEIALYRIIQEFLNNSIKYSSAEELIVQLTTNNQNIHLTIEDDGVGFDQSNIKNIQGLGLKNIESRVKYLGGNMSLESGPGEGVSLDILLECA